MKIAAPPENIDDAEAFRESSFRHLSPKHRYFAALRATQWAVICTQPKISAYLKRRVGPYA